MNFTAETYQSTSEEEMYNDPELVFGLSQAMLQSQ